MWVAWCDLGPLTLRAIIFVRLLYFILVVASGAAGFSAQVCASYRTDQDSWVWVCKELLALHRLKLSMSWEFAGTDRQSFFTLLSVSAAHQLPLPFSFTWRYRRPSNNRSTCQSPVSTRHTDTLPRVSSRVFICWRQTGLRHMRQNFTVAVARSLAMTPSLTHNCTGLRLNEHFCYQTAPLQPPTAEYWKITSFKFKNHRAYGRLHYSGTASSIPVISPLMCQVNLRNYYQHEY